MKKKIAMILVFGFEEIETIIPVDLLRRLDFDLILAGESEYTEGSHGVKIKTDCRISELDYGKIDCLILPGGMPGSINLRNNQKVIELIKKMNDQGKIISAICAAPIALATAGIISGKKITAHPSVKEQLTGANYSGSLSEEDGNIITGKGPGASFEFSCRIASALGKKNEAEKLLREMFII